jgi:hypothetical protein
MCTFWYVDALARPGWLDDARLIFEKMHTYHGWALNGHEHSQSQYE